MEGSQLPVIDFKQCYEENDQEFLITMVQSFENTTFDTRIKQMLEGMIKCDWGSTLVAAHTIVGSCGYIYAFRLMEIGKIYQEFIKKDCERIEYTASDPGDLNRPQYRTLSTLTLNDKLKAYDYFFTFMEEAKTLKQEMSKLTGSKYPEDIYDDQIKLIRAQYEELRGGNSPSKRTITHENDSVLRKSLIHQNSQLSDRQNTMTQQPQIITSVQPPQESKCCGGCDIF